MNKQQEVFKYFAWCLLDLLSGEHQDETIVLLRGLIMDMSKVIQSPFADRMKTLISQVTCDDPRAYVRYIVAGMCEAFEWSLSEEYKPMVGLWFTLFYVASCETSVPLFHRIVAYIAFLSPDKRMRQYVEANPPSSYPINFLRWVCSYNNALNPLKTKTTLEDAEVSMRSFIPIQRHVTLVHTADSAMEQFPDELKFHPPEDEIIIEYLKEDRPTEVKYINEISDRDLLVLRKQKKAKELTITHTSKLHKDKKKESVVDGGVVDGGGDGGDGVVGGDQVEPQTASL
ncbi:MAG: hypothetical protein K0U52_11035 [Gammaproteobacteria bacterium]|nr:hypothetical protein [Gammaproteobacteria bacterium]